MNTVPTTTSAPTTPTSNVPVGVQLDEATLALLQELDQKAAKSEYTTIPEIKLIQTDKQVMDYSNLLQRPVAKGDFVAISYNENGDKVYEYLGKEFVAVLLKNTNAYSLYNETEGKSTYYTNEFEYKELERVMVKRDEDKRVLFDGGARDVKPFLLKNFPGQKEGQHQFSYRNILYVVRPELIASRGPLAVYRIMQSHTSLDGVRDFMATISGSPIKYLTKFYGEPKLAQSQVSFHLKLRVEGDMALLNSISPIAGIVGMKTELDKMWKEMQESFFAHDGATEQARELKNAETTPAISAPVRSTTTEQPAVPSNVGPQDVGSVFDNI